MGGGGVMRAAVRAAGNTVVNGGLRGVPSVSPAEHQVATAAGNGTRAVSAIVSASDEAKSAVLTASQSNMIDAAVQRPSWELDDWEFAGGEEELISQAGEPMPRLVFGGAPTLQEAKEATSELKDALEKVYLSSPNSTNGHEPSLSLLSKPEYPETKACVTSETTAASMPKNALKAFRLLNESPAAQSVVASIASDPNVWGAVLQNEALVEFLQSRKSETDPVKKESVADAEFPDHQTTKNADGSSDSEQSADSRNGFMGGLFQNIKTAVSDMCSSLSDYFQNLFGDLPAEKESADTDGSARTTFVDKAIGASFMGLVVMVIMVVLLKRG
ncbi:hypothetical protein U1Q18_024131 [Sarracenia purpurea var. burkii]